MRPPLAGPGKLLIWMIAAIAAALPGIASEPSAADRGEVEIKFLYITDGATGAPLKPIRVPWEPELTVTRALKRTGAGSGSPTKGILIRGSERIELNLRRIFQGLLPNVLLQPGDTVEVLGASW